ncbi:hypothetical protein SAMN05192533_11866 [Mesobacillus persicus]|uniref:Uncharacterized protein n=1 Tax=Mesobacillus persicus TaxID=930146 RepID=A0A1H8IU89_9BACI|nr:hypothetical protein [Mesobacillus persicus]SEN72193.1 hypothetical protein SAMN05192533_11866 [Mesobacillus persicus]
MSNKRNHDEQNVSEKIKDGAGAAFHSVHSALEATENAAMSAVDATANAISDLTDDEKKNRENR